METLKYMYHATNSKDATETSGFLYPQSHFCCTLLKGAFPTTNPYGKDTLYVDAKYVLSLFNNPNLYIEYNGRQDREYWVNDYYTVYVIEGPKGDGYIDQTLEQLNITNNGFMELQMNGCWTVRKNDLGHFLPDGRKIYYWTNVMVEKQVPLAPSLYYWN